MHICVTYRAALAVEIGVRVVLIGLDGRPGVWACQARCATSLWHNAALVLGRERLCPG